MESTGRTKQMFLSCTSHLNICTLPNISDVRGLPGNIRFHRGVQLGLRSSFLEEEQ